MRRLGTPEFMVAYILCATQLMSATPCLHAQQPAARWPYEHRIDQFEIHADYQIASQPGFVENLGTLRKDISSTLQIDIQPETVHLVLFEKRTTYESYMKRYFPDVPARRALFIKRRGPGMVFAFDSAEMTTDLRHETTHALLNASLPYVPLWLDEGLAEYFETVPNNAVRTHPHDHAVRRRVFWGSVRSVSSLEAIPDLGGMGTREYQDAWSWVHFLLHESPASRSVLLRYLQELQAHSPPGQLSRRIEAEMPNWKTRYLAYFRH